MGDRKLLIIIRYHVTIPFEGYISFSSSNTEFYESRIFCLFTFWVFFSDKIFKLVSNFSNYIQKWQHNSLYQKEKTLCNTLKLGKLKFGIRKNGCSMSWTRCKFRKKLHTSSSWLICWASIWDSSCVNIWE